MYDFGSEQSNYSYPKGTATIAANTATATVRIPIFQDLDGEGVETYEVTLSDPQPGSGDRATYTVGASAGGSIAAGDFVVELWNGSQEPWEGRARTESLPVPHLRLTWWWIGR